MEDSFYLSDCGDDDVLSFGDDMFKAGKFRKAVNKSFNSKMGDTLSSELRSEGVQIEQKILQPNGSSEDYLRWFGKGINCEILNLGSKSWKKGKVRIKVSVEFYEAQEAVETPSSDKPEINQPKSPLDDIRRMMNEDSQQGNS